MWVRMVVVAGLVCWALGAGAEESLKLANGDTIHGEVVERDANTVTIEHPQLGRVVLATDQLAPPEAEQEKPGLLGTSWLRGWKRRVDLGLNGREGNTDNLNLTTGFRFRYRDDTKFWSITGRYFYATSDDEDDDNNGRVTIRRDWSRAGSRWFVSATPRYQYDQFESWKQRVSLFAGPGYHIVEEGEHRLDITVGPGYTREFGERDDDSFEGGVRLHYHWDISDDHSLDLVNSLETEITPDAGDLRNLAKAEWSIDLPPVPGLSLNLGLESEWESDPEPGDKKHDFKYFLTLGLDL